MGEQNNHLVFCSLSGLTVYEVRRQHGLAVFANKGISTELGGGITSAVGHSTPRCGGVEAGRHGRRLITEKIANRKFAIFSTSHPIAHGQWGVPPFSAPWRLCDRSEAKGAKPSAFLCKGGSPRQGGDIVQPPYRHLSTLI